jgi:hypothetical protein
MMRRIMFLATVALVMALMLAVAGPASARGCQAFGTGVAENVQTGTLREEIPDLAPVNDDVQFFQGALCG